MLSVGRAHGFLEIAIVFGAMLIVLPLTFVALLIAGNLAPMFIGRVLGVILAALAAQYVLDGIGQIAIQGTK